MRAPEREPFVWSEARLADVRPGLAGTGKAGLGREKRNLWSEAWQAKVRPAMVRRGQLRQGREERNLWSEVRLVKQWPAALRQGKLRQGHEECKSWSEVWRCIVRRAGARLAMGTRSATLRSEARLGGARFGLAGSGQVRARGAH